MTLTPEHPTEPVAGAPELIALAEALRHAGRQLTELRTSAIVPSDSDGLLESIEAEAERLRMLLERRPLEAGCDPVHDVVEIVPPPAELEPLGQVELIARLDALDAESDDVLDALRAADPGAVVEPTDPQTTSARTFQPGMSGGDIRAWQRFLNRRLHAWRIEYEVDVDGDYGDETALWSRRVLRGMGLSIADGDAVPPQTRIKARHPQSRTAAELAAAARRRKWLGRLRRRYSAPRVHTPVEGIITSSHGYGPGHDGIDLICPANAKIYAVCRAKVIDVRSGGWWGKNPTGDPTIGDGIIQLEALESIGPLRRGMHIGYGHAEHATVRVGQIVKPGDVLGRAGYANAWHIHKMMNHGRTMRGIGEFDPRPCLNLFTSGSTKA
jgi:hypothetical protein